jgi:NAD(P)-dependent dehydrogenase (short-subunit alcohol dehydrogenase family)
VLVLGEGRLATAIRREVAQRSGLLIGPYDAVVDASDDVLTSLRQAREMDTARPRFWFAVTRLGTFDLSYPLERAFMDGARGGFAKALGREWTETIVRVVGVQDDGTEDVARAAVDELTGEVLASRHGGAGQRPVEVFRAGAGRRTVAYLVEAAPPRGHLAEAPVVLVTGGARGISARIALEIARRGPARLALVGRGPAAEQPVDFALEKERIKALLRTSNAKVTPVEIDKQLEPLRRAEEVRQTLAALSALNADVRYVRADLADPAAVARMLAEVTASLGPIRVAIHGAGVEESRLIAEKDDGTFSRVFDGKARGGLSLIAALDPDTYFVSMGSVAGRFGNAGQVDYAAANEAMARVCLARPRSLHVDWTAWDDVGMAVRGGMKNLLSARGVDLLPADAGAGLLVDLIASGVVGEIVVAGRLGDISPNPEPEAPTERVEQDGDTVRVFRTLSPESDVWLRDHAIDDVCVLPGVMGLEMMAEAAARTAPGLAYSGARDLRFDQPLKLYRDEPARVIVEAEPLGGEGPRREVRCRLVSERRLRTGRTQRVEHFRGIVQLGTWKEPDGLPSAFLPDEQVAASAIYERFFHGPAFQVLRGIQGVSADGMIGEASRISVSAL